MEACNSTAAFLTGGPEEDGRAYSCPIVGVCAHAASLPRRRRACMGKIYATGNARAYATSCGQQPFGREKWSFVTSLRKCCTSCTMHCTGGWGHS
eukprot:scaffold86504_cov26-Tisochrysis_lutea.AAC.4